MRNKEIRQVHLLLQIPEEVDNLCLNRNIQSGNRLIADNKLRLDGKGSCDTDSLTLTAGKLMRETACVLTVKANGFQQLTDTLFPAPGIIHVMDFHTLLNDGTNRHSGVK